MILIGDPYCYLLDWIVLNKKLKIGRCKKDFKRETIPCWSQMKSRKTGTNQVIRFLVLNYGKLLTNTLHNHLKVVLKLDTLRQFSALGLIISSFPSSNSRRSAVSHQIAILGMSFIYIVLWAAKKNSRESKLIYFLRSYFQHSESISICYDLHFHNISCCVWRRGNTDSYRVAENRK